MDRVIYLILGSSAIIGLSIFSMSQFDSNRKAKSTIKTQNSEIKELNQELETEKQISADLRAENGLLKEHLTIYKDSIFMLKGIVSNLQTKARKQRKLIALINKKQEAFDKEYQLIKSRLQLLNDTEINDKTTIADLEQQKMALAAKIENLNEKKEKLKLFRKELKTN